MCATSHFSIYPIALYQKSNKQLLLALLNIEINRLITPSDFMANTHSCIYLTKTQNTLLARFLQRWLFKARDISSFAELVIWTFIWRLLDVVVLNSKTSFLTNGAVIILQKLLICIKFPLKPEGVPSHF